MTLSPPTAYEPLAGKITNYRRDNIIVAFSTYVGNDYYYFANSEEFNRLKPAAYLVADFRVTDLTYDFENEAVLVVDRNVRIPSGYMLVRPWYPSNTMDLNVLLATYPNSKSEW